MTDSVKPVASVKLNSSMNNVITNELIARIKYETSKNTMNSILDDFIDMIMSGRIQSGYVFPNENEMCKQLSVSRSTLREVYSALAAMGFISRSKPGTIVNDKQYIASAVPLRYLMKSADMDSLRDFRFTLESQTACFAAQRASLDIIQTLHVILDKMKDYASVSNAEKLSKLDYEFHITISKASGNLLLLNTLSAAINELESSAFSGYYLNPEISIPNSVRFHQQILDAIEKHQPDEAKRAMEAHIKDIYVELYQHLPNQL